MGRVERFRDAVDGLFLVGLILVVVWAVRQLSGDRTGPDGSKDRAVEILEERYARGEIDRDEFQEGRRTLRGDER